MSNRRFKLLKDLPETKAGEILVGDADGDYYFNNEESHYAAKYVENNPEWFSEIIERKDWQITKFVGITNPHFSWTLNADRKTYSHNTGSKSFTAEGLLGSCEYTWHSVKSGDIAIHSVKRLSDSTVLSIQSDTNYGEIAKFEIDNNKMYAVFSDGIVSMRANINELTIESKQPEQTSFQWTDELVMEIVGSAHRDGFHKEVLNVYDRVKDFKQSHSSPTTEQKKERIKVSLSPARVRSGLIYVPLDTPQWQQEALRKMVEEHINGEYIYFFTQSDIDQARREAIYTAIKEVESIGGGTDPRTIGIVIQKLQSLKK